MKRNKKILLILFLLFIIFLIEFILRENLENFSEIFYLKNNPLEPQNKALIAPRCIILKKLSFFEFQGKYILIFFIFNFSNIYAAFSFIFLDSIAVFLNGILKLLYNQPRPFWKNPNVLPCFCSLNFGAPSTTALDQFLLLIVFYKAFTHLRNTNKWKKIIIGSICLLLYFSICFARLFQSAHSINQIILGLALGFSVYFIFFEIFGVNFSNEKQFKFFFDHCQTIIITSFFMFFISIIFHQILNLIFSGSAKFNNEKIIWEAVISHYCDIIQINLFDNETYFKSTVLFLFFGVQIGINLDYILRFDKDYKLYSKYYFERNESKLRKNIKKEESQKEILDKELFYSQGKNSNKNTIANFNLPIDNFAMSFGAKNKNNFFSYNESSDISNSKSNITNSYFITNTNPETSNNSYFNYNNTCNNNNLENNNLIFNRNNISKSFKINNSYENIKTFEIKEENENDISEELGSENQILLCGKNLKKDQNSIQSKNSNINKYFYNKTDYIKSNLRFLLMTLIYIALYKYILIFGDVRKDSLLFLITFKFSFCNFLYGIVFFFIFPNISSFLNLSNDTLFHEIEAKSKEDYYILNSKSIQNYTKNNINDLNLNSNLNEYLLSKNENWQGEQDKKETFSNKIQKKRKISEVEEFIYKIDENQNSEILNVDKSMDKKYRNDYISLGDSIEGRNKEEMEKDLDNLKIDNNIDKSKKIST